MTIHLPHAFIINAYACIHIIHIIQYVHVTIHSYRTCIYTCTCNKLVYTYMYMYIIIHEHVHMYMYIHAHVPLALLPIHSSAVAEGTSNWSQANTSLSPPDRGWRYHWSWAGPVKPAKRPLWPCLLSSIATTLVLSFS